MPVSRMKKCQKCKTEKSVEMFYRNRLAGDGYCARCKECERARKIEYSRANKEKIALSNAARHAKNKEAIRKVQAKWRAANKDRIKSRMSIWFAENKNKKSARDRAWKLSNPEKVKIANKNARAKRKLAEGKLSTGIEKKLFKLQRGKCACGCKQPLGTDYHLDHRMPLALGGTNTDDNIQLLTAMCNLQKHAKHPLDFMQSRGFLL